MQQQVYVKQILLVAC